MTSFKEPSFAERQNAVVKARKAALEKFRAKPGPDDAERKAAQLASEARDVAQQAATARI